MNTRAILSGLGLAFFSAVAPAADIPANNAPVATAATTGTATHTYQCYLAAFGANYMTPAFTSAKDSQTLNADWRAHILQVHPASGVAQTACSVVTPAEAKSNFSRGYASYDWKE